MVRLFIVNEEGKKTLLEERTERGSFTQSSGKSEDGLRDEYETLYFIRGIASGKKYYPENGQVVYTGPDENLYIVPKEAFTPGLGYYKIPGTPGEQTPELVYTWIQNNLPYNDEANTQVFINDDSDLSGNGLGMIEVAQDFYYFGELAVYIHYWYRQMTNEIIISAGC